MQGALVIEALEKTKTGRPKPGRPAEAVQKMVLPGV
jgi:hypothetical protein